MTKYPRIKTSEQTASDCVEHEGGGGALGRESASSPDSFRKPENSKGCVSAYNQEANVLIDDDQLEEPGMAESVTRHALNPLVEEFKFLLCGIDTLDLGLYVSWGPDWKRRLKTLNKKKQEAGKKKGLLIALPSGRKCIFKPGGKDENYRFHLQFEAYNLYIAKAQHPNKSPNVYLSISAKTLWLDGIEKALFWIAEDLTSIGRGRILFVQVSRADLCADFFVPGGLCWEFLLSHKVTRSKKTNPHLGNNDEMETYYVGEAKSPIELRIYDKGLEVRKAGTKLWFIDLWNVDSTENIWRIEFQLRRPFLKRFGINSLDDLKEKQTGLWKYLTAKWFSLRCDDNEKAERRTVHPFWCAVQECFGTDVSTLKPVPITRKDISPEWHLSHIDGCLSSFAARLGITNRDDALLALQDHLNRRKNSKDFEEACVKKAIQKGTLARGDNQ